MKPRMGASLNTHTPPQTHWYSLSVNNHRYCADAERALFKRCNNALICPGRICCHAALLYTSPFFPLLFFPLLLLPPPPPPHTRAQLLDSLPPTLSSPQTQPLIGTSSHHHIAVLFFILRKGYFKKKIIRRSHPPPVFPPWQATKRSPPPSPPRPPQWSPRTRRRRPAGRTPSTTRGPASCWGARRAAGVRPGDPPGEGRRGPLGAVYETHGSVSMVTAPTGR